MLSVTDCVRRIILDKPMFAEMLLKNYLNLSSFAIDIIPQIQLLTYKTPTKSSVVMALSRVSKEIHNTQNIDFKVNDVSVKYPLSEINFPIPIQFCTEKINSIYKNIANQENHYLNVVSGNSKTTIFVNTNLKSLIFQSFKDSSSNLELDGLASVSLKFSSEYFEQIGITYKVLQALAWNNINLVEVVSTYTEITLIIKQQDTQRLIDILNKNFV